MPDTPAIHIKGLWKRYGLVEAVRGMDLQIDRGEMFGLVGPDGAGKTTVIRLLCGILEPDEGELAVLGYDLPAQRHALHDHIGYLSQRFSLYEDLSIDENIEFFAEMHRVSDYHRRRDELLEFTRLTPFRKRLAGKLSGGMRQKLALACTLIHRPALILLDEPTTGVDPVSRREFWKLLGEFLAGGLTILIATPYLDEAERCSRVALVSEGRILALDTPDRLRGSLSGVIFEVVAPAVRRARDVLIDRWGGERVEAFGDRLHVRGDRAGDRDRLLAVLADAGLAGASVRQVRAGLEDVFIDLIGRERHALAGGGRKGSDG